MKKQTALLLSTLLLLGAVSVQPANAFKFGHKKVKPAVETAVKKDVAAVKKDVVTVKTDVKKEAAAVKPVVKPVVKPAVPAVPTVKPAVPAVPAVKPVVKAPVKPVVKK